MKGKILAGLGVALLFLCVQGVSYAESQIPVLKLEELNIQVMPEYAYHPKNKDKENPPLLIGYHGTLLNTTDSPQKGKIEIPLPMDDDNFRIGFVADYNQDLSEMNEIEYKMDKKMKIISWEPTEEIQPKESYKFVLEYYTNQISAKKDPKTLSYQFKSFADIGLASVVFLEPLKTSSFKLTPEAESHQENGYGMNMFLYQYQGLKAGETKEYKLEYSRSEKKTTMELMEAMAGSEAHSGGAVKKNETISSWVVIAAVGGFSVLASVLLILLLKRKKKTKSVTDKKTQDTAANIEMKKTKLRAMLLEGTITEKEYQELLKKLGG